MTFRIRPALLAVLAALPPAAAQDGVSLRELPELLRERSARQRPEQLAALEPFLTELELDYDRNVEVLDETVKKVAALGDGIVPILLEHLAPEREDARRRHLAENSARVLALLEPRSFLDALIELSTRPSPLTRRLALDLLGRAEHPRAVAAIRQVFPSLADAPERTAALVAMRRLASPSLVEAATALLGDESSRVRAASLRYLTAVEATSAQDRVIAALGREQDPDVLPLYVRYLATVASRDPAATEAVLPLVLGARLDPEDLLYLVEVLGELAPEDHRPARDALRQVVAQDTSRLGITAALSLQALGDKRGPKELFDQLEQRVRRRRSSSDAHADLADAQAAFGRWREAVKSYEQAIKHSRTNTRKSVFLLHVARCEAHRDNTRAMLRALDDAGLGREAIEREARTDPVFEAALRKDQAQRFLRSLEGR